MAYNKAFSLFSFTLLLLLLPFHSHATLQNSHGKKSSPFEFLKHLQGCHKGEKVKGIHNLKAYLENFGYLSYNNHSKNHTHTNDDDFDELLESAIKTYQLNYHFNELWMPKRYQQWWIQGRSYVGAWGGHGPPNFFNSPLELVKKNYKLLKLHVNLFTAPPNFRIDSLKI